MKVRVPKVINGALDCSGVLLIVFLGSMFGHCTLRRRAIYQIIELFLWYSSISFQYYSNPPFPPDPVAVSLNLFAIYHYLAIFFFL